MTTYTINERGFEHIVHILRDRTFYPLHAAGLALWCEEAEESANNGELANGFVDVELSPVWTRSGEIEFLRLTRDHFLTGCVEE